jgi:hypothetical protein
MQSYAQGDDDTEHVISRKASVCTQTQKNAHTYTPNIHALSGIRTHDPGFRASEDSACLRQRGYRDRIRKSILDVNVSSNFHSHYSTKCKENIFI